VRKAKWFRPLGRQGPARGVPACARDKAAFDLTQPRSLSGLEGKAAASIQRGWRLQNLRDV
jgi:hypothetical protein